MYMILLWIPTHGRAKAGRPARTYIQQLCEDTGCCPEDLPRAMNDREEWRERVRDIRATQHDMMMMMKMCIIFIPGKTEFFCKYIYIYIYTYIFSHEQNAIQGQFYAEFHKFEFRVFLLLPRLKNSVYPTSYP